MLGIRHHGPGSARSVVAELDRLRPSAVLIEGPADADPLLALAADPGMVPPVALLAYAPDEPRVSAFWPFAVFSPEWQALSLGGRERGAGPVLRPAGRDGAGPPEPTTPGQAGPGTREVAKGRTTRSGSSRRRPATTTRSAGGTT